jgi:two-component system response regulator AtoC
MATLLIVEDEDVLARSLVRAFAQQGYDVHHASTLAAADRAVAQASPDVVLLDLRLPDGSGLEWLATFRTKAASVPVIMMTAYGSVNDAVAAMQQGALDYVQKPLDLNEIRMKVERAVTRVRDEREVAFLRRRETAVPGLIGESAAATRLRSLVEKLARVTGGRGSRPPTVLLLGETGSGKGHVARLLYASGGRAGGPFIEVNCTALPETLIEAELFGHEKGAFTDAKSARIGLFEAADGGTIFLDEIGHVSPALQAKFLRVIETHTIRRVGSAGERTVDVQVIAATNRDLEAAVRLGEFREDLHQRLRVAEIRIPPLRERERDVLLLARAFLDDLSRRYGGRPRTLAADAEASMLAYHWPGNVRELANTLERAVLFSDEDTITAHDLALSAEPPPPGAVHVAPSGEVRIEIPEGGLSLEAVERALLSGALERAAGNQSAAARLLGISRDTLRYRLEKYGLLGE